MVSGSRRWKLMALYSQIKATHRLPVGKAEGSSPLCWKSVFEKISDKNYNGAFWAISHHTIYRNIDNKMAFSSLQV